MEENNPLKAKQVDHLILLVGGNPLPNAVATQLLATQKANIWLLHSDGADGEPSTKKTAENLETFLRQRNGDWNIHLEPIPSANNVGIEQRVKEIVTRNKINGRVGLHYTGGTKSMAVHVYSTIEKLFANSNPRPIFSYLDPRKLALRIDGYGTESQQMFYINKLEQLRNKVEIDDLNTLAKLHNYEPAPPKNEFWEESNAVKELAQVMVQIHTSLKSYKEWELLRKQWRETPSEQDFNFPDPHQLSSLKPVIVAFDNLCGGPNTATPALIYKVLKPNNPLPTTPLRSCSKWFLGVWLELYVATVFFDVATDFTYRNKNVFYRNRNQQGDGFELDLVGIKGYQLFAFSCIATTKRAEAKEHFFEVYVRARQLGGDEARIGLICLLEDSKGLENEIENTWEAKNKIKVFGKNDLKNLKQAMADWFRLSS